MYTNVGCACVRALGRAGGGHKNYKTHSLEDLNFWSAGQGSQKYPVGEYAHLYWR